MRVFLAVELPAALRERLATAAASLLRHLQVRRVAVDGLHVTIRFLGEIEGAALDELLGPLAEAVGRVPAGTARAHGWGAFPSPRKPRVVWCGVTEGRETLEALERAASSALTPFGFPPESRAYHPHITVARVRSARRGARRGGNDALTPALQAEATSGDFPVRRLTVFRSHLARTGARYEVLHELRLRETPKTGT